MAYFPAFIQLEEKTILLVGGGEIAYEKLEKLLDFTRDIHIIAREISPKMQLLADKQGLFCEYRPYKKGDIQGYDMVIIAVDDLSLQEEIYLESRQSRCLCNAVDSVTYCDFIFPAYIKEDDLTIAISTSGASPAFAKHFKHYLRAKIPEGIGAFLTQMKALREELPKGKERMRLLDDKVQAYMKGWKK